MRASTCTVAVLVVWSAGASGGPDKHAYEKLLCGTRPRCAVADVTAVGAGKVVVKLEIPDENAASEMDGCAMAEHSLVAGNAAKPTQRQLLATGYTGSCGAVGNGGGVFRVARSTSTSTSAAAIPTTTITRFSLSLSPLGFDSEHGNYAARFPDTNVTQYSWSWVVFGQLAPPTTSAATARAMRFQARTSRAGRTCTGRRCPRFRNPSTASRTSTRARRRSTARTRATRFDGHAGSAADASFRAAIAGHELLVEVTDDHLDRARQRFDHTTTMS